ncbi:MAG: hypothetical protein KF760_31730 [Candidatus Eremiobacteraeota bacterium]|nr:hypothetical protein [Candidatus Eremiobacteraeota bacterium]MCW5871466.1 hypothetical protein [Candidatus Eremiobacteraeota bacterium]
MASSVGNSGFNINQQFANQLGRGEGKTAENLRNQSGVTHTAKKTTVKRGGNIAEEGSNLSPAAREALKSEQAQHAEHMAEHGNEMAHQAGLDVPEDDHEQAELQRKRGYDRDQELLAEGPTADGKGMKMAAPDGTIQVLKVEDHEYLTQKMDDPDFTDAQLLDDIPPGNLEAASAVMDTQMAQGVSKVAVLKTDPKIDAVAETMEMEPTSLLVEPMDIRDTTNDPKMQPIQLELPLETHQVAAEKAAAELASGSYQEEAMIAGGIPGGSAAPPAEAAPASKAMQDAQIETDQNDRILSKLEAGALTVNGNTVPQRDGYEAVRNNAQERFMAAYEELPAVAQQAVHSHLDKVKTEFNEDPTATVRYRQAGPDEKADIETGWMAEASRRFVDDPAGSLKAVGGDKDLKLDAANLKHLDDGARHYQEATKGLEKHTEPAAAQATQETQATQEAKATGAAAEAATVIKTDGPFPTAEMPGTATTQSLKQFSDPLAEMQLTKARSQLTPGQKADLESLESDVGRIRQLFKEINANPNDKEAVAKARAEVAECQSRIGNTAGRYQQPGALQVTFDKDGEVCTHLSWRNNDISNDLKQQGYQGINYTMMSTIGKNDYQLTARPTDGYGQSDGTYVQYRVASDDPKRWQGVAAVVGNAQGGVNGYHACTTSADDPSLRIQLQSHPQNLSPGQNSLIRQCMGDTNLTWPSGASVDPKAAQQPGQPQQPVAPGYMDYMRYAGGTPNYGYYPQAWMPQQPMMPYMNSYPNYMSYPPTNYGGMPGGGWNSWGGMGMGGMNGMYGLGGMYGMGGGGMDFTMKMFAASSLISSLSFPLMMFSMF